MSSQRKRLDTLEPGEAGVILEIDGDDVLASRLMEMGLNEDEQISMIGRAPMGDPIEFSIRGYRLSLRRSEAARVWISYEA
jgi:ferrous iron transport protein A